MSCVTVVLKKKWRKQIKKIKGKKQNGDAKELV